MENHLIKTCNELPFQHFCQNIDPHSHYSSTTGIGSQLPDQSADDLNEPRVKERQMESWISKA